MIYVFEKYKRIIFFVLLGILTVLFSVTLAVKKYSSEMTYQARLALEQNEEALLESAKNLNQDLASLAVDTVVTDCLASDRERFFGLLNKLNSELSSAELLELKALTLGCGQYGVIRQGVLVLQLDNALDSYKTLKKILLVENETSKINNDQLTDWNILLDKESQGAKLQKRLVDLQLKIIDALLAGSATESAEIKEILKQVNETQEALSVTSLEIKEVRQRLNLDS